MRRPTLPAALALLLSCALHPRSGAATEIAALASPDRVEVVATSVTDDARDATAARRVVTREELARHGDTSIVDVLRRVPGITVTGAQGRASDVRLHGLGSGYTQILLNGEAVPGGFSLDALSPAQIERIEVSRVATVDVGAQAIAGTINIILRQGLRKGQRELKASVSAREGQPSYALDGQFSDRLEGLSYSLGAGLSRKNDVWPSTIAQHGADAAGTPTLERLTRRRAVGQADSISLTPKLAPQWGDNDKFSIEALLRHTRFNDHSDDRREALAGELPRYASNGLTLDLRTTLAQGRMNWTHALAGGATVDTRLGANLLRRASASVFLGQDEHGDLAMDERVGSETTERGITLGGKFRLPYSEGHAVALGWDGEHTRRSEWRSQRQTSPIGRPVLDLDENYRSTVQRLALYVQDEWDLGDALSAYAGVRWAALRTHTEGAGIAAVGSRSAVLSPVLQVLWKPEFAKGDQLRFALSRTYKPPRTVDLIPRRYVSIDNTPTTPNLQGNPELQPELAWGVDLAYEHALARNAGSVNLSASARRIDKVILERLFNDNGVWTSTKANQGSALVFGLELDSRWRLRAAWPGAPDVDLRASASRNWSHVNQIPGPDNRLDNQVPLSANLGADWRLPESPLTLGGSLAFRSSMRARSAPSLSTTSNAVKTLDLYALWKVGVAVQWRASVSNLLRPHDISSDTYSDASGSFHQSTDAPGSTTVRIGVELKL